MFETLNDKFEKIVLGIRGKAVISESDLDSTLREIRIALLEADVALIVVKDFISTVKENILGKEVLKSIKPDQMIIKLVQDELVNILGLKINHLISNLSNHKNIILWTARIWKNNLCCKTCKSFSKIFKEKSFTIFC